MGSPVTLSGFNQIDFSLILNAVMQQERIPVTQLESQKKAIEGQKAAYSKLASKLAALNSAAEALRKASAFESTTAVVSDPTRLSVSASGTAPAGTYELVVNQLARSQVSTATPLAARDTVVATGGSLTIGGTTIEVSTPLTLDGLASAINSASGIRATASVVRTPEGYALMLTGRETGAAGAFTVENGLTGGEAPLAFTTRQSATDASITINSVEVTSATNTFTDVIAGTSFTALRQDPGNPVIVTITADNDSVKTLVEKLAAAFNDVKTFLDEQQAAATRGETSSIARDPLVRGLRSNLAGILTGSYASGGPFDALAQVGFSFARTGTLEFDAARFDEAMRTSKAGVQQLFRGLDGTGGVFGALVRGVGEYTTAGGLLPNAQDRLTSQASRISDRISELEARLAIRREALQREFAAADLAISQLRNQSGQLSQLGGSLF